MVLRKLVQLRRQYRYHVRSKMPTTSAHRWKTAETRKKLAVSQQKSTGKVLSCSQCSLPPMSRSTCGLTSEPLYPGDQTDRLFMYTCTVGTCEMR